MNIKIGPKPLAGNVDIISSKSDAHRVFIAAALSKLPSEIWMNGCAQDIAATISCLQNLGAKIEQKADHRWSVEPIGYIECGSDSATMPPEPLEPLLDCHESGSTLRFLIPVAAALGNRGKFTGQGRLPERPIGVLLDELKKHGCTFSAEKLPFQIGGAFTAGRFELPGNISSQFITGLLFALPLLEGDSEIILTGAMESKPYVDMTIFTLKQFHILVVEKENRYWIKGGQTYLPPQEEKPIHIDGDWSNGAFWLAAGAVGKTICCRGLYRNSHQGDKAITALLEQFGCEIFTSEDYVQVVPKKDLRACSIDASQIPDLVPILAVIAATAEGTTQIYGAGRLRIKESDRLAATKACLSALGIDVVELPDGLRISGRSNRTVLGPVTVSGYNDHRMVMAMAIAAIAFQLEIIIQGAEAVKKSYPSFFEEFERLGGEVNVL